MNKNLDKVAEELFDKIRSQFPSVKLGDKDSGSTNDPAQSRFFDFDYIHQNKNLGKISISLHQEDGIVVIYSANLIDRDQNTAKRKFFNFLKEIRQFAKQHLLSFDTRDITKSNLDKRDYGTLARKNGETTMSESKLFGTSKTSYQNLGDARLIIKHSAPINFENPVSRSQKISSIYIENAQGERFKYPLRHLNGARALAQHISHGGTPYDSIGQHVVGLSEELHKLKMFKSYVERNQTISEAMSSIADKVLNRIVEIKKTIHYLQNESAYKQFAEGFVEPDQAEIPEEILNDWVNRLTVRTFNEELKNAFPYIFRLVSEEDIPIKEITADDLIDEQPQEDDMKSVKRDEISEYTNILDSIIEDRSSPLFSDNPEDAIEKLNQLMSNPFPVGVDAANATESLKDIIDDDELMDVFKELADISEEIDIRSIIMDYINIKNQENSTNKITFDTESSTELQEPINEPMPAAQPAPMPAAQPAPMPAAQPAPMPAAQPAPMPAAQPAPFMESLINEKGKDMKRKLIEFIKSMYNEESGNFPKGVEGVKIACEKKFGEQVGPVAAKIVERMSSMGELKRIRELSGLSNTGVVEDLQADDGQYYDSADDFFSQFEADHFDDEQVSDDGMEIRGYIDGENVMVWRYNSSRKTDGYGIYDDSGLSEHSDISGLIAAAEKGIAEGYPKHQDLSGISTDKLKAYLDKQSKQQVSGEGNQVKRVRAELQRRQQGVAEGSLEEYGDTDKGQKMLSKVQNRAAKRIMKNWDDPNRDFELAKKNRDNAERAYDRIVGRKKYSEGMVEGYSLKKTSVSKYMEPGDPDEWTQDVNIKDTDYEIINNKTGQVVGTASWTTNDYFGPGALKITMKNGATRWLDIWEREKGNPQTAFNRFVKDPKTAKKYKEQGVAEGNDPWWMDRAHPYLANRERQSEKNKDKRQSALAQTNKGEKQYNKSNTQGVAEVSQQTLQSYRKKAEKQKSDALDVTDRPDTDDDTWVKNINIASKRKDGIAAANKRLGVAEGFDSEELADEVYAEFERMYPKLARRANQDTVHAAIMDVLNYGGDSDPSALAQDVARAVKRDITRDLGEGVSKSVIKEFAPGDGGDNEGDGKGPTLTQAVEYIKSKYKYYKKYTLDGSHRYMNPAAVADWAKKGKIGPAPASDMGSVIKQLGMTENPKMYGMDTKHIGREDWWKTFENNRTQIAMLHFVGQHQGWILVAGNSEQNLTGAVQVFRDSGVLPDLTQARQNRQDRAASRLSKLSITPLKVGDMFGVDLSYYSYDPKDQVKKKVELGWDIWKVLEFTKTGKIKAQKIKSPTSEKVGEIKLFDPKGRLINNKKAIEVGKEYKNQQAQESSDIAHTARRLRDPKDGTTAKLRAAGHSSLSECTELTRILKNARLR